MRSADQFQNAEVTLVVRLVSAPDKMKELIGQEISGSIMTRR